MTDRARIEHILDAIAEVEKYLAYSDKGLSILFMPFS